MEGVNFLRFRDRNESAGRCHSCHIQRIVKKFFRSDLTRPWNTKKKQKKQNKIEKPCGKSPKRTCTHISNTQTARGGGCYLTCCAVMG